MSDLPALACTLNQHEGEPLRFGPDEADPYDIPIAIEAGTEVPGWGFAESKVVLKRPPGFDLDANLLANGRIYDETGETISMGRVVGFPRVGVTEIEIDFEGPLAHLDDDTTAAMIFRDTSFADWTGASAARKAALALTYGVSDPTVTFDPAGNPALELKFSGAWANAQTAEAYYDAGPQILVAEIYGEWLRNSLVSLSNSFTWEIGASDDDVLTGTVTSGDLQNEPSATGAKDQIFTTAKRIGRLSFSFPSSGGADGSDFAIYFSKLAVYGNHGLPKRGTEPDAGLYGSDVVPYVLGRWAPLINIAPNGIEQATYPIPQLTFPTPTTAREMLVAASLFGASGETPPDWGYYEDGFFWKTPGTYGRTWRVRRDEAVTPEDDGPTSDSSCNGYIATFTDSGGASRSVGPPGSGSDYELPSLLDTSPTNPVNAAGIPRRYGSRSLGTMSALAAARIAQLLMADANSKRRSGSAQITGTARDEAGNEYPAYMMRAGDLAVIEDDEDPTPCKIASTSYAGKTLTATLDNQGNRIEGLLARSSKP